MRKTATGTRPRLLAQRLGVKTSRILRAALLGAALSPIAAQAAAERDLLERINAYRADPGSCDGVQQKSVPPLAADSALDRVTVNNDKPLQEALKAVGYPAAQAESIALTGPEDAKQAFDFVIRRHCKPLLSTRYTAAGISHQGNSWQIILAQPLLAAELGDWREAGGRVLALVNAARARSRLCGTKRYQPVQPIRWNDKLAAASLQHSREMAQYNFVAHEGRDGRTVEMRATASGYAWRVIGENVAAGQGSPRQVVDGWLASPGHCANIMNGAFREMGAAYAVNPESDGVIYWTQVFGTPR